MELKTRLKSIKNIVILCIDTLRVDCISAFPDSERMMDPKFYNLINTPNLDYYAKNGLFFVNAVSCDSSTTTAHASLFTGRNINKHGIRSFYDGPLKSDIPIIFDFFKALDYNTFFDTDFQIAFNILGLTRGVENYFERNDRDFFKALEKVKDQKNFIFYHFFDIHDPYLTSYCPPESGYHKDVIFSLEIHFLTAMIRKILQRKISKRLIWVLKDSVISKFHHLLKRTSDEKYIILIQQFLNSVFEKDHELEDVMLPLFIMGANKFDRGRFKYFMNRLKSIIDFNESLIIILADHGESLTPPEYTKRDKYMFIHGYTLFEDQLRVPVIFYSPDIFNKKRELPHQISIVDIFPTLYHLFYEIPLKSESLRKDFIYIKHEFDGHSIINATDQDFKIVQSDETYAECWVPDLTIDEERMNTRKFAQLCNEHRKILPHRTEFRQRSLRTENFKLLEIINVRKILLDLRENKVENITSYGKKREGRWKIMRSLEKRMNDYSSLDVIERTSGNIKIEDEIETKKIVDQLQALGYM